MIDRETPMDASGGTDYVQRCQELEKENRDLRERMKMTELVRENDRILNKIHLDELSKSIAEMSQRVDEIEHALSRPVITRGRYS